MSATLPAIEFSIGIIDLRLSSSSQLLKQSSKVLHDIVSDFGNTYDAAS